jgi:hypothetical protein
MESFVQRAFRLWLLSHVTSEKQDELYDGPGILLMALVKMHISRKSKDYYYLTKPKRQMLNSGSLR